MKPSEMLMAVSEFKLGALEGLNEFYAYVDQLPREDCVKLMAAAQFIADATNERLASERGKRGIQ